jgi:DNA-binding winged helix-turn-helix (wHTH) protein/TolB-like protein
MRYHFGLFEFDDVQLVLRKQQVLVALQLQPARVLACLLRNRERIVSRDELQKSVWGDSTFVDFNRGLNFCIAQVRSALGDDSSSPRYVRTVPKLGYQFIAPSQAVEEPSTNGLALPPHGTPQRRVSPRWLLLLLLAVVSVVAVYQLAVRAKRSVLPIIAVARFDNETGDPALTAFADALTDDVVAQLTNGGQGRFSVIGNAHLLRVPRDQRDLTMIGAQLNAKYIVLGQVMPAGNQTRVIAHLIRLPEQTHLWVARLERSRLTAGTDEGDIAESISAAFSPRLSNDIHSGYSSRGLGR